MLFDSKYFQQIFGLIMGTNIGPILTNIYMALLENELKTNAKQTLNSSDQFFFNVLLMMGLLLTQVFVKILSVGLKNSMNFAIQSKIDKYNWGNAVDSMDGKLKKETNKSCKSLFVLIINVTL